MSRYVTLDEALDLIMLGGDDLQKRSRGRYLTYAKYVFQDLKLDVLKNPVRKIIHINKRTNTIDLGCDALILSSVNLIDKCGAFHPVFRNDSIHDDLVDVSASKDCACEYKCGYRLCNSIKGYEAITTIKSDTMPNGDPVSFTCVDRKAVDSQGFFYEQTQYPLRVYEDGEWVNTILHTEDRKLCKVQVDSNGCVCDTDENVNFLCNACGYESVNTSNIPIGGNAQSYCGNENVNEWIYYCNTKFDWFSIQCGCYPFLDKRFRNIYNISEDGGRLIFPPNFGFDKVMVRTYENINLATLQIPFMAVPAFGLGIKWYDCRFNDKKQMFEAKYKSDYTTAKWGLLGQLNKYRVAELRMITTPPVYMPSYIDKRDDIYNW